MIEEQQKEKVINLFQFIKEICSLRTKIVRNINDQKWHRFFYAIPKDDNITINYRDRIYNNDDAVDTDDVIFSVQKPTFQPCPEPNIIFKAWLNPGWDDFSAKATVKNTIKLSANDNEQDITYESFDNNKLRVQFFTTWIREREHWANEQQQKDIIRRFFIDLYQLHIDLNRDSEAIELMVGNGILMDKQKENVNHPILLKKVKTKFNSEKNIISICDTNSESELYTTLLSSITDINRIAIQKLKKDLYNEDYHPLDRRDLYAFLKKAINSLCPESQFLNENEDIPANTSDKLFLSVSPVLFVRKRINGFDNFIEQLLENIKTTANIPQILLNIIGCGKIDIAPQSDKKSIAEQLAEVGGEDINILLTKPANREQLEIAQQIEQYNAVLVQGPPGTGKTHTIANLIGHFLATGRTVLVTSYTKKALSVLKDQVPKPLQNLCVSILDDSNEDMERSVDGITEYLSKYTASELRKKADSAKRSRDEIIQKLATIREKIYAIKFSEFNTIVYNGDSISPSSAARFVYDNANELSYIPGKVELYKPLPLSFEELSMLYQSNSKISSDDEYELACKLPDPIKLISADKFNQLLLVMKKQKFAIEQTATSLGLHCTFDDTAGMLTLKSATKSITIDTVDENATQALDNYLSTFKQINDWMTYAVADGKRGGSACKKWQILLDNIRQTCKFAEDTITETFGKEVHFDDNCDFKVISVTITKMQEVFADNGKISYWKRLLHKNYDKVDQMVSINGKTLSSAEDCSIALHIIELNGLRDKSAHYWNELMGKHGAPKFMDLNDGDEPEIVAKRMITPITRYLDWYNKEFSELESLMDNAGLNHKIIFSTGQFDSEIKSIQHILKTVTNILPDFTKIQLAFLRYSNANNELSVVLNKLATLSKQHSVLCNKLYEAFASKDTVKYAEAFINLNYIYQKHELQAKRENLLQKLYNIAPEWANSIRNRVGIHGKGQVPDNIEDAWRWKQYCGIIQRLTAEPFDELQRQSISLSKSYREITTKLAEYNAWYYLLKQSESDLEIRQALQGWKQTTKKIGKGTGKNVPRLRAEARKLMAKCQSAVPAWIMTINTAINNLVPGKNMFDVIIIDEASQADISALPIMYLAKKIIVVGDDKQVSPMAIGVDIDKMNALADMYIKDKIPNWHLYNSTSSIYDIAQTVFQPLMLREHFRCVPDIIGFSNAFCYDYKIKPLRDTSDCKLIPAIVNYRTSGVRERKINKVEAETITALIMACLNTPEYDKKTIGIISLLGDDQAKLIQKMLFEHIEPAVMEERRILCGDASHFQGDERDVIFLSMVDSNDSDGPLKMISSGPGESTKKRYNVAVSRAKDQLWVVNSLDAANDLKPGDIRQLLLDYATDPSAVKITEQKIMEQSESPFEESVAKKLSAKGFNITQQWPVGAYRIDMVIADNYSKVALECDGEHWHSSEEKIRQDMERQTILERIGWRFIRIRGSEYYSNPDKTIDRVIKNIKELGINPIRQKIIANKNTVLLQEIKLKAAAYLSQWFTHN